MTLNDVIERMRSIKAGVEAVASEPDRQLTDEEQRQLDWYIAEFSHLEEQRKTLEARAAVLDTIRGTQIEGAPVRKVEHGSATASSATNITAYVRGNGNPWDAEALSRTETMQPETARRELVARALDAVERAEGLSGGSREKVTRLVESVGRSGKEGRRFAREILAISDPAYRDAFGVALESYARTGQADPASLSVLSRAASLTDAAGGYRVPLDLDPTLILNDDGSVNPFREISTIKTTTSDVKRSINSTAVTASWDAEGAEVSDDMTTLANIDITPHKASTFVPLSIEIAEDYPGLLDDLRFLFSDARSNLEATAFATGSGSGQPVGIVTALTGGSYEVASNTTDTFALSDVYDIEEELPARFSSHASWVANKKIYTAIREAGGANLDDFWVNLRDGRPATMLGRPTYEASAMDGTINAAAENYVLILGDFRHYWIVDRIGLSIEFIPHLFHTSNNRPSGQRGLYAHWRVGADSVNDRAFRMLNAT